MTTATITEQRIAATAEQARADFIAQYGDDAPEPERPTRPARPQRARA